MDKQRMQGDPIGKDFIFIIIKNEIIKKSSRNNNITT